MLSLLSISWRMCEDVQYVSRWRQQQRGSLRRSYRKIENYTRSCLQLLHSTVVRIYYHYIVLRRKTPLCCFVWIWCAWGLVLIMLIKRVSCFDEGQVYSNDNHGCNNGLSWALQVSECEGIAVLSQERRNRGVTLCFAVWDGKLKLKDQQGSRSREESVQKLRILCIGNVANMPTSYLQDWLLVHRSHGSKLFLNIRFDIALVQYSTCSNDLFDVCRIILKQDKWHLSAGVHSCFGCSRSRGLQKRHKLNLHTLHDMNKGVTLGCATMQAQVTSSSMPGLLISTPGLKKYRGDCRLTGIASVKGSRGRLMQLEWLVARSYIFLSRFSLPRVVAVVQ